MTVNDFVNPHEAEPGCMGVQLPPLATIRRIFDGLATIAVVGLSPKPQRPSNRVARYLREAGFRIIPVNPGRDEILGEPCYPDLRAIPERVDLVDIFRRAELVLPVVRDAIAIGARAVWLQEGIVNPEAARMAEEAGLLVVMDRCIKDDHARYVVPKP